MRKIVFTEPPKLDILYQDAHMVAINKPSGLLVHRSPIDRHETLFAVQLTRDLITQPVFPIHRLDKPTSGVLLFALSSEIAKQMQQQMQENLVQKTYLAICRGFTDEQVCIDYPLVEELDKLADKDRLQAVSQPAVTALSRLNSADMPYPSGRYETSRYSLLELQPKTGRRHQLRRHLAHIRHPIIGDTRHGDGKQNKVAHQQLGLDRLALHAKSLKFNHPVSNLPVSINAPLDETLTMVCEKLGWSNIK